MSVTGSRHIPDDTKNKKGEWTMYREDGWVKGFYQDNLVKYEALAAAGNLSSVKSW